MKKVAERKGIRLVYRKGRMSVVRDCDVLRREFLIILA
jgi:hypothetical protein